MYCADFLFIDNVCPQPYETSMLKTKGMGGSESSLIKIAEGLGAIGVNVAVYEHNLAIPVQGEYATFINREFLDLFTDVKVVVHQRKLDISICEKLPKAKHLMWCHDLDPNAMYSIITDLKKYKITVICVSKFQMRLFKKYLKGVKIDYIYNPIHDNMYKFSNIDIKYDNLKLVWMSSPHKDLEYAVSVLDKLRAKSGLDFKLHCFNPGYIQVRGLGHPYVIWHGSQPNHLMLREASDALCLFMPMHKWKETFCIVAAEANCIQLPVVAFKGRDALDETAQEGKYLCSTEEQMLDMLIHWHKHGRPTVCGNSAFKLSHVLEKWLTIGGLNE